MTTPPLITDSHCHLDFTDFEGELPDILARAAEAGVHRMVTICTRLRNEPGVRALAEANSQVFYAAGTHPMSAAEEPLATVDELIALTPPRAWRYKSNLCACISKRPSARACH
jgi:TatD DNase family protein